MDRREFVRNISLGTFAPMFLGGIPVSLMASNSGLQAAAGTADNDRVLVLIQMHGGNDGLNAVIPMNQYNEYYNLRPNIAIPDSGARKYITLDSTLADEKMAGLHPDMVGIKELYDHGKAAIIQGVSYANNNQSHFRSRDIWFMGSNVNEYPGSGWAGRLLDKEYVNYPQDYPNTAMPDPLALEIGSSVSLLYHRTNGIPVAISIYDPEQFYSLVQEVKNTALPEALEDTYYGKELKWIREIEKKSDPYSAKLKELFEKGGKETIIYPTLYNLNAPSKYLNNSLAPQLRLVARLLAGGIKTKIFLVKIGGFDTHANQVEKYDSTMGNHAALLYHLSSAVKVFQDDLKARGIEDRVATVTFSEFGRRAASNGSYGCDHGNAAPMFMFGKYVKPGIIGTNPDLNDLQNGNIAMQNDYRRVFRTILEDWLKASTEAIAATGFDKFEKLDLISDTPTATKQEFQNSRFIIGSCVPNPARLQTSFSLQLNNDTFVSASLYAADGRFIGEIINEFYTAGIHQVVVPLESVAPGIYTLKIDAGVLKGTNKINVIY